MDQEKLEHFKHRLEDMFSELRETVESKTDATATVELDGSIGRLSRIDALQSQQMALGLRVRQQQAMVRVQNALNAIRNGTYGHCRRCKGEITLERLEAQPDAVLCVQCAK
jgi:DnaK suppressor protein